VARVVADAHYRLMNETYRPVAIITGASQGIGAALVPAYRELGYAVVATSRTVTPTDDPEILTVPGDIAEPGVGASVVRQALDRPHRSDGRVEGRGRRPRTREGRALFTGDAIFQGLHPYSVGRRGVADYYASQPLGMTADYRVLETRRLADDLELAYLAVDFGFTDRPPLHVNLSVIVRGGSISHYQVSDLG
jgi:NAD(P)-dependent dehydrogenase (short-subunit alcohol dehydrogenase family)